MARIMALDQPTTHLVKISAAVTLGDEALVETVLRDGVEAGLEVQQIREMLLQVVLFSGFPRVINAFEKLAEMVPTTASGEAAPVPADYWEAEGRALFGRIYGRNAERVVTALQGYHPDLADWILRDAYGKVLSRPALSPQIRELAAVAMLSLLNLPRQLLSHARGALHVGATAEQIRAVVDLIAPLCSSEIATMARTEVEKAIV